MPNTGKPNQVISPAPLCPIPVVDEPFQRVIVDSMRPLPNSKTGNQSLLTIMCVSTRSNSTLNDHRSCNYQGSGEGYFQHLVCLVIQADQGTNFKSKVFAQALKTLGIDHITFSPYHPESQGVLERFNQTLELCC